jgi:GPH family glycoside/pentoside/hexuronide:cation symporter
MMMLNGVWLYPPRLLGWWPENGEPIILWMNLLFMFVFMYFFLLRAIMSQSIAADIADEHDYRTGHRQEGSFFAALNFSTKMASVLGPAYGGAVLDIIGLSRDMPPGSVPESVLNGLAGWYMVGAGAPLVVAFALTFGMLLTQTDITRMQIAVAQRSTSGNQSEP